MIVGDPLLHVQRPITPPGVRHANPVHDVARTMIRVIVWSAVAVWLFSWMLADPMPRCVYEGEQVSCLTPPG